MPLFLGVVTGCGSGHRVARAAASSPPAMTTITTTVATVAKRPKAPAKPLRLCPLTDSPAPGGVVPDRPALAVKVENLPEARPQYGLATADVIYEEPVEGGITRFIVIYQCQNAARIEPIRSGRIIDPELVMQFGPHPLFAYAGAIQPAVAAIDASPLIDVGIYRAPLSAFWRDQTRYAPHNLVSSTEALYAAGLGRVPFDPPPPVFRFGALPHGAAPADLVHIAYPESNLTWAWQPATHDWLRSYADTGLATLGDGGAIHAVNVIVMRVVMYASPYVEDATGSHENLLVLTGSGPAEVFRDGAQISGRWERKALSAETTYVDGQGHPIPLRPGPTWIELVPMTVPVAVAP